MRKPLTLEVSIVTWDYVSEFVWIVITSFLFRILDMIDFRKSSLQSSDQSLKSSTSKIALLIATNKLLSLAEWRKIGDTNSSPNTTHLLTRQISSVDNLEHILG